MKSPWVFIAAFALAMYTTGAGFIESFVNYPSWQLIGEAEFTAYHRFISPRVLLFLVLPAVLCTVFTIAMLWFRPVAIPVSAVWLSIALQAAVWISTATIQVPIQLELGSDGLSIDLIDRLIHTNLWLRRLPHGLAALLFLWMMARALRAADRPA